MKFFSDDTLKAYPSLLTLAVHMTVGIVFMILCSKIAIPFLVPVSFQTLGLYILSMSYSPSVVFLTLLSWFTLGIAGFPVFSGAFGIPALFGPTGGYLVGLVIVGPLLSLMYASIPLTVQKSSYFYRLFTASLVGSLLVLCTGWLNLAWIFGHYYGAFCIGFAPFILIECMKSALFAMVSTHRFSSSA